MNEKVDEIILLLKSINQKLEFLVADSKISKEVKPSNTAILKQFEETEKLFNKVMNKDK